MTAAQITMILDRIDRKSYNVIDSNKIERDAGGKPILTLPHLAPERIS